MRSVTPYLKKSAVIILVAIMCLLVLPASPTTVKRASARPAEPQLTNSEPLAESAATVRISAGNGAVTYAEGADGNYANTNSCTNSRAASAGKAVNFPTTEEPPTVKSVDQAGYTLWTTEFPDTKPEVWADSCIPVNMLYPIDLGDQDPQELGDVTLRWVISGYPGPLYWNQWKDPSWSVVVNSGPPDYNTPVVGSISATPFNIGWWRSTTPIPIDADLLIDGKNTFGLVRHDHCPKEACPNCACTCISTKRIVLRATVAPKVKSVSPRDGARNVWFDQSPNSEIRVSFNTVISSTTVNENTFQVYYFDQSNDKVYVDGQIAPLSENEFAFVPDEDLLDGVRYVAQLWGKEEAENEGREEWVKTLRGGSLAEGKKWSFTTIPNLQVKLVPVQVIESEPLVTNKRTVLKTFIRWNSKPNVLPDDQLKDIEIYDIKLVWSPQNGAIGEAYWRSGNDQWKPIYDKGAAKRKREYLSFTKPDESYTIREKRVSLDSINFTGFTPETEGGYMLLARVDLKDNKGRIRSFGTQMSTSAATAPEYGVYWKAVGVGVDYGKTGTVDLSRPVTENRLSLEDIYPVPSVAGPAAPAAMAYYTPTTWLFLYNWTTEPASDWVKGYLTQEMSALCARTTGCRAMVGLTSPTWLVDGGFAPLGSGLGAVIRNNSTSANRFTAAHEIGHLADFDHIEMAAAEGYNVRLGQDKRYSIDQDVYDFMSEDPVESGAKYLWISRNHYQLLGPWVNPSRSMAAGQPTADSAAFDPLTPLADPLLLVSGLITETTGAVTVWPWYQMAPGEWRVPEAGLYNLVFVDGGGQEIAGYTRSFSVSGNSQPKIFTFVTPYPATMAKVQIRRMADNTLLKEITASASAPTVSINPPGSGAWQGPKPITWQTDPGTRSFALDVSTDNGVSWEALAIHLKSKSYTLQTTGLPNTTQAWVRVAASDGLRTTTTSAGPFTIDNPPLVAYVLPSSGASGVGVNEPILAGFRDAMDPATLTSATFTLSGGPYGTVPGTVTYDAENYEATFTPKAALAYSTTYTAMLTTGIKDTDGTALPAAKSWSFTTEADRMPPQPLAFTPRDGEPDVPLNASLAVVWDEALNPVTINPISFTLATASGTPVSGAVSYNATTRLTTFNPAADLAPDTRYIATLKAGIQDTHGNPTEGAYNWSFTTGDETDNTLGFTGSFYDYGVDSNGDGLYEQLVILAGVQITTTDVFTVSGRLTDSEGGEIDYTSANTSLQPGTQFVALTFNGYRIGGHGADGPYTLAKMDLYHTEDINPANPRGYITGDDLYLTFAYTTGQFPANLRFSGLPDLWVTPGATLNPAFNVRDYAQHALVSSDQLTYTVSANSGLYAGIALTDSGALLVNPSENWQGSSDVTIQASYGADSVQDTFRVNVGWQNQLYLPVSMRFNSGLSSQSRTGWRTAFSQDFESGFTYWGSFSTISIPPGGWYKWGIRDCAAFSGSHSAWAIGGADDGSVLPCGSSYPNTLKSTIYYRPAINLKYTNAAEFSVKLWSNLAAGDQVCIMATTDEIDEDWPLAAQLYGNCRGGATNGWVDFKLDLSHVPVLGNLLGREKIWVAVKFIADQSGTLSGGAYIDDAVLRVCPVGITCQP